MHFRLWFFGIFLSLNLSAQPIAQNFQLLSNWDNDSLPVYIHGAYNEVWGYADSSGNEFAILGSITGTHFINVTDPQNPVQVAFFPGRDTLGVNRDFKTYGHYAYGICDQGQGSLQIFDLSGLPAFVTKIYDSTNIVKTAHTLFIENSRIYFCGAVDSAGTPRTLIVTSIENPENPVVLSTLTTPLFDYVHASFVQRDTAFLSCGNAGLFVYDYRDSLNPVLIQQITAYPQKGYNHTNWVSKDGKTMVFTDETHGSAVKNFDISAFDNPVMKSMIRSNLLGVADSMGTNGSTAHNPVLVGTLLFCSYYQDGLQVFDITDPDKPVKKAYFDTEPFNTDYLGYRGAWGVYPFLPSRNILVSDMNHGLFVLNGDGVFSSIESNNNLLNTRLSFENPQKENIKFKLETTVESYIWNLFSLDGRNIISGKAIGGETVFISGEEIKINSGIYFLSISQPEKTETKKIIFLR